LAKLLHWYSHLSPETLSDIGNFYDATASFKDPFNTVQNREGITAVFQHMFKMLETPVFIIREQMLDGEQVFITWDFQFRKGGKDFLLHGGSHLRFNASGKVIQHRDYWDSAEELLHKLPLIGPPLRLLRRMLSVRDESRSQ